MTHPGILTDELSEASSQTSRSWEVSYSKWDRIAEDDLEELCTSPLVVDNAELMSWHRKTENDLQDSHKQAIVIPSLQHERTKARREGTTTLPSSFCWTCRTKAATLRCGRCKLVFFCGKECQRKGWKM